MGEKGEKAVRFWYSDSSVHFYPFKLECNVFRLSLGDLQFIRLVFLPSNQLFLPQAPIALVCDSYAPNLEHVPFTSLLTLYGECPTKSGTFRIRDLDCCLDSISQVDILMASNKRIDEKASTPYQYSRYVLVTYATNEFFLQSLQLL